MTNQLTRRQAARLTLGMAAGAAALSLEACAGRTSDELAADVEMIANGLSGIVWTLSDPALKVPADILAKAQAAVDDIKTNAALVGAALTPNADAIKAVSAAVTALSALLAPFFPLSPIVAAVVQAALTLLPTLLSFISAPTPPAAVAASRKMTQAQAKAVLQAAPKLLAR